MKIIVKDGQQDFDHAAAMEIVQLINKKPNAVIGLATGHTPKGMYKVLGEMCKNNEVDFSNVITFNLDEYLGIKSDHPGSCKSYLQERFYDLVNLKQQNIYHLNSQPEDYEEECHRYNRLIQQIGGIDLLILGIGHNGHLGFNEPNTSFKTEVHVCQLTDRTRTANIWSFGCKEDVPTEGITMGIKNIMGCKKLMLLANGEAKADIVKRALKGVVTEELPASVLQLHNDVVIILDKEANELV